MLKTIQLTSECFLIFYFVLQGTIKGMHNAVVKNDLEVFKKKIASPVSSIILCSKDANGLNVLHKVTHP